MCASCMEWFVSCVCEALQVVQVSQKGKKGDGGEDGGSHLEPDDLMGLTVSQHVSLRVSAKTLLTSHTCCTCLSVGWCLW